MKPLFFFLLLVNVVLALYVQVAEHRRPALDLAALQLHPEKMRIVTGARSDENAASAPAVAPAAKPEVAPPAATTPSQPAAPREPSTPHAAPAPQTNEGAASQTAARAG